MSPPTPPAANRREFIGPLVDGILTYWLNGTHNEELRDWWESSDAADCALEFAHLMLQTLEESGFRVVPAGEVGEPSPPKEAR